MQFKGFSFLIRLFGPGFQSTLICSSRAGPPKIHTMCGKKRSTESLSETEEDIWTVGLSYTSSKAKLSCLDRLTPSFTHQFKVISQIDG